MADEKLKRRLPPLEVRDGFIVQPMDLLLDTRAIAEELGWSQHPMVKGVAEEMLKAWVRKRHPLLEYVGTQYDPVSDMLAVVMRKPKPAGNRFLTLGEAASQMAKEMSRIGFYGEAPF